MIETIPLVLYAFASVALALLIRRAVRIRLDWSHERMRRPFVRGTTRHVLGTGALGAADAVNTTLLSSASPNAVWMVVIAIAGLAGGFVGTGLIPAFAGEISQPGPIGLWALVVTMLAWVYIGGRLAVPVVMSSLALIPILLCLGALIYGVEFVRSSGPHGPLHDDLISPAWKARYGSRVDRNSCAAGVALFSLGSQAEVDRHCRMNVVDVSPVVGQFAGTYNCGTRKIAAIVNVIGSGPYRDGFKSGDVSFSDRPEEVFPLGSLSGSFHVIKAPGTYLADGLVWQEDPGRGWGLPRQLAIDAQPDGGLRVELVGSGCAVMLAKRCQPTKPGDAPVCFSELAQQGVKPHQRTLQELNRYINEGLARQKR